MESLLSGNKGRGLLMGQSDNQQCCAENSGAHTHTRAASFLIAGTYWRGANVAGQRLPIVTFPLGDETANWRWDLLSSEDFQ